MDFNFTLETSKSINDVIQSLEKNLKEESFGVLWNLDMKKKLDEKGFNLEEEFCVLEVCNPKEAKKVIEMNKLVGYFLPCKIVVYKDKGTTKVGMPRPTALIGLLENDELKVVADDIENRLIACLKNSI